MCRVGFQPNVMNCKKRGIKRKKPGKIKKAVKTGDLLCVATPVYFPNQNKNGHDTRFGDAKTCVMAKARIMRCNIFYKRGMRASRSPFS
jgi:hypothetical protein